MEMSRGQAQKSSFVQMKTTKRECATSEHGGQRVTGLFCSLAKKLLLDLLFNAAQTDFHPEQLFIF